jgi:hypothetical protein
MDTYLQSPALQINARVRRAAQEQIAQAPDIPHRSTAPGWLFVAVSAVCVAVMLGAGMAGSRDCRALPVRVALGQAADLSAAMPANVSCVFRIDPGDASIEDLRVDVAPAHGRLETRGRAAVVYRPKPGFKGEDRFELSLVAGGGRGTAAIRMQMKVK